jgi:hypothetical protein
LLTFHVLFYIRVYINFQMSLQNLIYIFVIKEIKPTIINVSFANVPKNTNIFPFQID